MSIPMGIKIGGMIVVGVTSVVLIAWQLWSDPGTTVTAPALVEVATFPSVSEDVVASREPESKDIERTAVPPDLTEDVSWERLNARVEADIDPMIAGKDPCAFMEGGLLPDLYGSDLHSYIKTATVEGGELRVVSGTSNGYGGCEIQIRVRVETGGSLVANASVCDFGDVGPPFNHPWTNLAGQITLSGRSWESGSEVWLAYDIYGECERSPLRIHDCLRVTVN